MASPQKVWSSCLRRYCDRRGLNVDSIAAFVEFNFAIDERKQCPITSSSDVMTGGKFRSALADDDAASGDELTAVSFHAQPFADAIASIPDAALTFLVCHRL